MWKLEVADGSESPFLFSTNNFLGRQIWKFYPDLGTPQELHQIQTARENFTRNRFEVKQSGDIFKNFQLIKENKVDLLSIPVVRVGEDEEITDEKVGIALRKALRFSCAIQASDGHWPSEFSGELFLTPPLIICLYVTKMLDTVLSDEHRKEILRYIYNHQNEDGGWGFHVEGHSTMLCTTLNYISLRLLGQHLDNDTVSKGQKWIVDHGGAIYNQIWGKIFLCVLGVYEWKGCNPVPPEILLVPSFLPFSAEKMWCFLRALYNPISYLYAKKFVGPITDVVMKLRKELYVQPYHRIDWNQARHLCLKEDNYAGHSSIRALLFDGFYYVGETCLNRWPFSKLRERALKRVMTILRFEDQYTRFLNHCCLAKELHMMAYWAEDPTQEAFKCHLARVPDYLWIAEDGMKVQNLGTQLWDAVFYVQAILASNIPDEYGITLKKAHEFIKQTQTRENPPGDFKDTLRYPPKGSWPLADRDQGWQVSDCTAEALTCLMLMSQMEPNVVGDSAETQQLYDAVDFLLTLQNKNGGMSAWEPPLSSPWLEKFNPTESFSRVMIEHVYGEWGICYIYGTFFALRGLAAVGKTYKNSNVVSKGCDFLLSKQLPSGGWGESYLSCPNMRFEELDGNRSNLVQTAWAMIGLIYAGQAERDIKPLQKAVKLLINSQEETGEFPQQSLTGASLQTCMLHYASHRNIFPLWALGLYKKHVVKN